MRKNGLEECEKFWDLSGRVPVAKYSIPCPSCQSEDTVPREYMFRIRQDSPSLYRCNVYMKCQRCSMAIKPDFTSWVHGVVIPESMFRLHFPEYKLGDNVVKKMSWREAENVN